MASSSNYYESSKHVKYGEGVKGVDKISSLPEKIVAHILSFPPTKHAVGSSILSRRWKDLFTLLTNFDFDETLVLHPTKPLPNEAYFNAILKDGSLGIENLKLYSTFINFADTVLMLSKATQISKFRVNCRLGSDCSNVNMWIRFALLRGVTGLDIFAHEIVPSVLPLSLFVSETLVVLKLGGNFKLKFPESFLLPRLRILQLDSVTFSEDSSLNRLISGCPVLKELVLEGGWEDVEVIDISFTCLRSLTMNFSGEFTSCQHRTNVVFDLPNLLHFNYVDYLARNYHVKNFQSLEDARIDLLLDIENLIQEYDTFGDSAFGLLDGISGVD